MLFKIVRNAVITMQKSTPRFYFNQTIEPTHTQQDEMFSTVLATEQYKYKFNYICG
ncbi:unnamed protein product [Paramecium primaurelia]|uniref:Uncharacterized protein n=1 Tax=Paramecium primaurelia TaxID=5886 RepID=A0A8S1MPN5_PARPR|nr:unnamed protein product [Paramecium primaurelia]